MNFLNDKKILLGITGGIAAYKCAELTRRLTERGAQVRVVMTESAQAFITPLTMQAVSGHPVADSLLDPAAEAAMGHIELAKWADLVVIAPATANSIANIANGLANDLLSTLCLATAAPIAICPAMNQQMWAAKSTQRNINTLQQDNILQWGPAEGEQACGDIGAGRMLEPMQILQRCEAFFTPKLLAGKKLVLTAGPTQEAIDPVRYISNHSSGKMGYALAQVAANMGADVSLISGPVSLPCPENVQRYSITDAQTMLKQATELTQTADIFIACAAVADYRVTEQAEQKIKKNSEEMTLALTKNPDVLATISANKGQLFTVGFAAETENLAQYAMDKLQRKNLDMIAANNVALPGQGFASDNNALSVFWSGGQQDLPLNNKTTLAFALLSLIAEHANTTSEEL